MAVSHCSFTGQTFWKGQFGSTIPLPAFHVPTALRIKSSLLWWSASAHLTRPHRPLHSPRPPHAVHFSSQNSASAFSPWGQEQAIPSVESTCTAHVHLAGPSHSSPFSSDAPPRGTLPLLSHSTLVIAFMAHISNWIYRFICWIIYLIMACECYWQQGQCQFVHRLSHPSVSHSIWHQGVTQYLFADWEWMAGSV